MNRSEMIQRIASTTAWWDIAIVGGGASGLGAAVDAASRGYKTLLLEQHDFAKGTSSRSTKLIHGGVRYLQQGNISLVLEALHERGLLIQNAPHLVHHQSFLVPSYDWWEGPFYGVGLKVYDLLAGKLGLKPSRNLSREETLKRIPTLEPQGLRGGVLYFDGQFDDARLAINLAQTAVEQGATVANYCRVTGLKKNRGMINGLICRDEESGAAFEINARVVVNATGVFTDQMLQMDDPAARKIISPSQGVHLVLDKSFLPGETAIMVPHTDDGRVLFAVPWHNVALVGTTDTAVEEAELEPRALPEEVDFILKHAAQYLSKDPTRKDVLSVFAGLRPLVDSGGEGNTAEISRDHYLKVSASGLVTIAGGKWTTYRKMAEETINSAIQIAGLHEHPSATENLRIHGWLTNLDPRDATSVYGSDAVFIEKMIRENPQMGHQLDSRLPYRQADVIWAVRQEMAVSVEDVLARRTRALLLNARAAVDCAPQVALLMAAELQRDDNWQQQQVKSFQELAAGYITA